MYLGEPIAAALFIPLVQYFSITNSFCSTDMISFIEPKNLETKIEFDAWDIIQQND